MRPLPCFCLLTDFGGQSCPLSNETCGASAPQLQGPAISIPDGCQGFEASGHSRIPGRTRVLCSEVQERQLVIVARWDISLLYLF